MPRYTDSHMKDKRWLKANLKTALIHEFTDRLVKVANGQMGREEVLAYRSTVIRKLAEPFMDDNGNLISKPVFGRIFCAAMVMNWFQESEQLVDVYRRVAPEGMGRETIIVDILIEELQDLAISAEHDLHTN